MTIAWLIDLLTSLVMATIVGGIVAVFGAPTWAVLGFGLVYYLLRPVRAQARVA